MLESRTFLIVLFAEMRKAHIQTVGVLPVRNTGDVATMNIMMQGKPVLSVQDTEIAAIQEVMFLLSRSSFQCQSLFNTRPELFEF